MLVHTDLHRQMVRIPAYLPWGREFIDKFKRVCFITVTLSRCFAAIHSPNFNVVALPASVRGPLNTTFRPLKFGELATEHAEHTEKN